MTRKFVKIVWRMTVCIGLLLAIFYGSTLWYVAAHTDGDAKLPADCGIVFGTAVWPVRDDAGEVIDAVAGPGIRRRVSSAASLVEQGSLKRLFLTGGKGEGNQKSEGDVMREYALMIGVPADTITVEDRARSTWENLENTRPLTSECTSIVAISDGYHLARIALQARMQGISLTTHPAGPIPSRLFIIRNLLREAIGIDLLVLSSLSR